VARSVAETAARRRRRWVGIAGATVLTFTLLTAAGAGAVPFVPRGVAIDVAIDPVTTVPTTTPSLGPGTYTETLTVGTMARTFILHVPPGPAVATRPLVLVYHAATVSAATTAKDTDFEQVADQSGDLVAFMQGYKNSWNDIAGHSPATLAHVDDVGYTAASIALIEQLVSFDHRRIVAAGFSNGALMVEYLGCQLANELALIVPVEGELAVTDSDDCAPARPISVYEIHGTADTQIPYDGGYFTGVYGDTTVLSAPANVERWAQLDQCAPMPTTTTPSSTITLTAYSSCRNGVTATLRTIIGGNHVWGSNIGLLVGNAAAALRG
jgi:polyhydroxybutyrate depolymerase